MNFTCNACGSHRLQREQISTTLTFQEIEFSDNYPQDLIWGKPWRTEISNIRFQCLGCRRYILDADGEPVSSSSELVDILAYQVNEEDLHVAELDNANDEEAN